MAVLAVQKIPVGGLTPTLVAADAAGDQSPIVTPLTVSGRSVADDTVTIPAGEERMVGSFPPKLFNGSGVDANKVHVNYSAVTSVTVAAFTLR